ncbi:MAG: WecB/TagA/CpsF family glycosyltransferase [Gammaproteobacteria bacterium]|nr:WecB/TagA/CpsF family glycosyltransferase [Gammaproteobacteria bacterium]
MHAWTMRRTVEEIERRLRQGLFTQHVVVNVAKLVKMQRDHELRAAIEGCDIVNIDGAGVMFGGRILGFSIPERVTGIDLFHELLAQSEASGRSVYFLGARSEVLEVTVQNIRRQYPRLNIAGHHHGYFWDDEATVVDRIRDSGADLLFAGFSTPMKEQFIDRWGEELGVKFAMGVGGTFDIVAGKVDRAPAWMQKIGLEWLYRVIQEPRRMFMRYFTTNSAFAGMLIAELGRRALGRGRSRPDS